MENFTIPIQIRWSDIDQNRHLRHSAYYDYGALTRISFFTQNGLTTERLEELHIGPILFREEAVFKREVIFEDKLSIDMQVLKSFRDFSRWSIRHNIYKEDKSVAAIITIDGAWIDMNKRKLAIPDTSIQKIFDVFPKAPDFEWIEPAKK